MVPICLFPDFYPYDLTCRTLKKKSQLIVVIVCFSTTSDVDIHLAARFSSLDAPAKIDPRSHRSDLRGQRLLATKHLRLLINVSVDMSSTNSADMNSP